MYCNVQLYAAATAHYQSDGFGWNVYEYKSEDEAKVKLLVCIKQSTYYIDASILE